MVRSRYGGGLVMGASMALALVFAGPIGAQAGVHLVPLAPALACGQADADQPPPRPLPLAGALMDAEGNRLSAVGYVPSARTIHRLHIDGARTSQGYVHIFAERAVWDASQDLWLLTEGWTQSFDEEDRPGPREIFGERSTRRSYSFKTSLRPEDLERNARHSPEAAEGGTPPAPTVQQRRQWFATFLIVCIVVLLLFLGYVVVAVVLRNRLTPRVRRQFKPTDALDLWSLAGIKEARRRAQGTDRGKDRETGDEKGQEKEPRGPTEPPP